MTVRDDAALDHVDVLPVPDTLLVPLLDDAAAVLRDLDPATFPPVLRPLAGFGKQGLATSPARSHLRRAMDVDPDFRAQVVDRFTARGEVTAVLESWDVRHARPRVAEAAARADLPLLASALYAARPDGWSYGLGVVCASFDGQRVEQEANDDVKAHESQLASLDTARQRAEAARDAARVDIARLEEQLRAERRSRREREGRAQRDVDAADRDRRDAEAHLAKAVAETEAAEARYAREAARARDAERLVRDLRRQLAEQQAAARAAEAARAAAAPPPPAPEPDRPRSAPPRHRPASRSAPPPAAATLETPRRRASVPRTPGLQTDSVAGLDAMLRTRGIVVVVDGYNVSMRGWGDAATTDQRERLISALEALHLRLRCDAVAVFDGSDVAARPNRRRRGVRVVFSAADEEADPVIVREVEALPAGTPVVVASSDRWVRDHTEHRGAAVVSAETLLGLLRR